MNRFNRMWIVVGVLTLSALVVGMAGALPARSQDVAPPQSSAAQSSAAQSAGVASQSAQHITSAVVEAIGYQGVLSDNGGNALSGDYPMRFELYNQPSGGAPVFESGVLTVTVADGLFEVGLEAPQAIFDGAPLWLAISVAGETLSPRQEIRPAPYAMSLRPGATVRQAATGTAVRVESTEGVGLHGAGQVYGVYGTNTGASPGSGYGGYFTSTTGIGVYGGSTAQSSEQNLYAPGVSGYSQWGVGILGQAATGFGVYGTSAGNGIGGVGQAYGVYGASAAPAQGQGYGGYFVSSTGIGVSGRSTAQSSVQNMFAPGVSGYSQNGVGIFGESGTGVGGYFVGNIVATGSKAGYVVDIARNDGAEPLRRGDLVVVIGVADPVVGGIPTPRVRKADTAASTAVIGVVDQGYRPEENGIGRFDDGLIAPGDYLSFVTLGAFAAINVDAAYGAIQPGDLLVSSPTPGHAMRADDAQVGTVIGKALDGLDAGTGVITVMVTLQ